MQFYLVRVTLLVPKKKNVRSRVDNAVHAAMTIEELSVVLS